MVEEASQDLTELLARIPLFENLAVDECRRVLAICGKTKVPSGKTIYAIGALGNELLILLTGSVSIQMSDGTEVAQVAAVDTVGEMEICSAQTRAARVIASEACSGLTLGRNELEDLTNHDPHLGVKILKNIVDGIARKLIATNEQLQALTKK